MSRSEPRDRRPTSDGEAFLERFVLPLVDGGEVHVGAPLGAGIEEVLAAVELEQHLGGGPVRAIDAARRRAAESLVVDLPPLVLDEESLRLAIAVHDLLFLFHPAAGNPESRSDKLRAVGRGAAALAALPRAATPAQLVARHTMLHLFPSLTRADARVKFWVGQREFRGQVPPRRLTALPRLRRVHEEHWRVSCLTESASDPLGGAEIVDELFAASPLTDLLNPVRVAPPFDLGRLAEALADPALCRAVAYRYLEDGIERTAGPLTSALLLLLDGRNTALARFALAFFAHLHLSLLVGAERRDPQAEVARIASRGEAVHRDFCGLFPALLVGAPELALPVDTAPSERIIAHANACTTVCGAARVHQLVSLIARAVGAASVSPEPAEAQG